MPIVQCPECNTQFKVSEEKLGDGRDVRCSECKHVWFQEPKHLIDSSENSDIAQAGHMADAVETVVENDADVPDAINPNLQNQSNALLIEDEETKATSTKTAGVVFISLILITFGVLFALQEKVMKSWPQSAFLYEALGIYAPLPWDGLKMVQGVAVHRDETGVGKVLYVEAEIKNTKNRPVTLPQLSVTLLDQDTQEVLKTWLPKIEDKTLAPGEVHQVKFGFTDLVKKQGYVKVSFTHNDHGQENGQGK